MLKSSADIGFSNTLSGGADCGPRAATEMEEKMDKILMILVILCVPVVLVMVTVTVMTGLKAKKETEKIRVRRTTWQAWVWLIFSVIMVVVFASNAGHDIHKIGEIKSGAYDLRASADQTVEEYRAEQVKSLSTDRNAYLILSVVWLFMVGLEVYEVIHVRFAYVTRGGIYLTDSFMKKDQVKYRIDGQTLEIFYKKRETPATFEIFEDKKKLTAMLEKEYQKYQKA